jgi:hypothetical protein
LLVNHLASWSKEWKTMEFTKKNILWLNLMDGSLESDFGLVQFNIRPCWIIPHI